MLHVQLGLQSLLHGWDFSALSHLEDSEEFLAYFVDPRPSGIV